MSILWIIEKPEKGSHSLARYLQGDFPVRLFGSLESLQHLMRVRRGSRPDVLCVAWEDLSVPLRRADQLLCELFPGIKRIYFCHQERDRDFEGIELGPLALRLDWRIAEGWKLSRELRGILATSHPKRLVHYKNIALDVDQSCVRVFPEDEPVALPMKETRLLRFFMDHPGRCVSREELCREIWGAVRVSPRTVDSHISRLRKRLLFAGIEIENIYGDGYVFR